MHYSIFLLDLDHTLFDSDQSEELAFSKTMLDGAGLNATKYLQSYREINKVLWRDVEMGKISPQEVRLRRFEDLVQKERLDVDPKILADLFVEGLGNFGDLYNDARVVLEKLFRRVKLGLITNGLSEVQRARIKRLDLEQYFDAIVISAEVGVAKPGKEIFDIILSQLNLPRIENILMIGDSLSSDIKGGNDFGISTCWYNPNNLSIRGNIYPTYQIRELCQLLKFVILR